MMNRFDDVYDTTEQRQPTYSWAQSVDIINKVVHASLDECMLSDKDRHMILSAWSTILRGV
jgi:hypothetical protein